MSSVAAVLVNPAARRFSEERVKSVVGVLEKRGLRAEVLYSSRRGEMREIAAGLGSLSPEVVFVLGGDGTFNEAANGLVHSDYPLAFIPMGTTNVIAEELFLPSDPVAAAERALDAVSRRISLGRVAWGDGASRYFVMMAGAGFDASTVYGVSETIKDVIGKGAYLWSGMQVLLRRPEPFEIESAQYRGVAYTAVVGNGSKYGGRFSITPDASLFDPFFHVFVLKEGTRASLMMAIAGILLGKHLPRGAIAYFKTNRLSLLGNARLQTDGDGAGTLPVDISVEPDCLSICC